MSIIGEAYNCKFQNLYIGKHGQTATMDTHDGNILLELRLWNGYVQNLVWICTKSRVDMHKISCGYAQNLVWICTKSRVDMYKISCGYVQNLVWICTKSRVDMYKILCGYVQNHTCD